MNVHRSVSCPYFSCRFYVGTKPPILQTLSAVARTETSTSLLRVVWKRSISTLTARTRGLQPLVEIEFLFIHPLPALIVSKLVWYIEAFPRAGDLIS